MPVHATDRLSDLYKSDETAWLDESAALIRDRRFDDLDYPHLAEFLEDMARRDRREVRSRLTVLIAHLLKWVHQPGLRGSSWQQTIDEQKDHLLDIFDSATLRNEAADMVPQIYPRSVRSAVIQAKLPKATFPPECPWTLDEALAFDVLAE